MFKCRACGTESDSRVCPMCGAECAFAGDEWQTPFGSPQENSPKQHKKMAPPPSPINQPALLKDASPVFDPSASAVGAEPLLQPKPQKNFSEERAEQRKLRAARAENAAKTAPPPANKPPTVVTAKKVQPTAKKIAPEPPLQTISESVPVQKPNEEYSAEALKLPSDESSSTPAESVLIEKSPLTEAETLEKETEKTQAEVSADISDDSGTITSEGSAEEVSEEAPPPAEEAAEPPEEAEAAHEAEEAAPVDELQDEIEPEPAEAVEPEKAEDEELFDFTVPSEEKTDSKFKLWLKNDAVGALAILNRLIGGKTEQPDAAESMGSGWCLLIPAHLAAIILAGLCGWRLKNAGVFSGALSSVGASAIIWLEHTVMLTLLTSITLTSVNKSERLPSLLARVMTAFLPLCASTLPAIIAVYFVRSLCVPLLLLGAGLSLIEVYNALNDAGVTGKKFGMLRLTAFLLVYILSIGFLAGQFL